MLFAAEQGAWRAGGGEVREGQASLPGAWALLRPFHVVLGGSSQGRAIVTFTNLHSASVSLVSAL